MTSHLSSCLAQPYRDLRVVFNATPLPRPRQYPARYKA